MKRVALAWCLCLVSMPALHAEVTIVSADVASEVDTEPDREFPCETFPWIDPDSSSGLVFYRAIGTAGPIRLALASGSVEVTSDAPVPDAPQPGGTLEAEAWWGPVRISSGTAIGRSLTPHVSGDVLLQDADGSAEQYLTYEVSTRSLTTDGDECLQADPTALRVVPCTSDPRQQWIVDAEGRLRTNICQGEWACLVTPGLDQGIAPVAQPCRTDRVAPRETWAVEHWNDPAGFDALLAGLTQIQLPHTYWPVVAVEGSAVPLVLASDGTPIVAAGSAGPGRVAAFGTWQPVCGSTGDQSFEQLLQRITEWAGRSASPVVGLSPQASSEQSCFNQLGYTTVQATPETLDGIDVYVMRGGDDGAPAEDVARIEAFLRSGGGLLASHHAFFYWEMQQYPPTDNLLARVFSNAGVAWSEEVNEVADQGTTLDVAAGVPDRRAFQVASAFEAYTRHQLGLETLPPATLSAIDANMPVAVTAQARLTDVSPFVVAQRALKRIHGPLQIGPDQPFTWNQSMLSDMALRGDYVLVDALPAGRTPVHESAALFPGSVAPEVPRVTRTVEIDGTVAANAHEMWRGTGVYAPAGEAIRVELPSSAVGAGLFVQIGASFDNVMPHAGWLAPGTIGRFPWVTAGRLVQSEVIELASAFGGPVFIVVPAGSTLGPVQVEIQGAVEAPGITLDGSGGATWHADLQDAPLAELQGDHVIFSTRSSVVDSIVDPAAALQQLDAMVAAEAALVGIDGDHAGSETIPQRVVFDPFEEWGAHSGYPVHMTQSWDDELLDVSIWPGASGLWGFLHEVGHNHQQSMWTLNHQWETTCNIIAVYAFETVLGLPMSDAWGGNLEPAIMAQRTQDWLDSGQPYTTQGYDVGLYFFLYVKEAFGWEPFRTMYSGYRAIPPGQQPQTEQQKVDQLAVRLSQATGHNLVDWFRTFRFPLSGWVVEELEPLPPWDTAPF